MPLTVISLSQTPSLAVSPTGFSQGGSGSGRGEKNKWRSEKGKERDREDEDEADKGDKNNRHPDEIDPEDPSGNGSGNNPRSVEISFEILSKIYPIQDQLNDIQTLTMDGSLTITVLLYCYLSVLLPN